MAYIIRTDGTIEHIGKQPKLEALQKAVGGYIEYVPCDGPLGFMYCNEEGKLMGLPPNPKATRMIDFHDIIAGDVVVMELGDEEE